MKNIFQSIHEARMKRLEKLLKRKEYKDEEEAAKKKLKRNKPKRKLAASKLFIVGMFMICAEIIAFAEWMMYRFGDTSQIYVLIGIPTTLIVPLFSYMSKSAKENTQGGITFEMAMLQNQTEIENNEEENVLKE